MDIQQNKQVVMQGYEKFRAGDIGGLLQLFADDIEWVGREVEFVPFSGDYHGKQEAAQFFAELDKAQVAERFEPMEMIAEGERVAVMGQAKWTVRATGNSYEGPWVHLFTIRDGKVARFEQYFDTAAARDAFMPPDAAVQTGASTGTAPLH